jgi:DNA modification methylase
LVAFALRADGWYLRMDIVWSKPNPMPESVRDRPTRAHEYVFLLAKSARYYYDADAIREPCESGPSDVKKMLESRERIGGIHKDATDPLLKASSLTNIGRKRSVGSPSGRNKRSVWEIATQPYPGAHFAVFPEKLVEPCILAGTSEWGCCPECRAPWERVVEQRLEPTRKAAKTFVVDDRDANADANDQGSNRQKDGHKPGYIRADVTLGWRSTCDHQAEPVPCRVLDPFAGSGTVGLVAERLGRHSVLIDASEDYCEMARERTAQIGLFLSAK